MSDVVITTKPTKKYHSETGILYGGAQQRSCELFLVQFPTMIYDNC